MMTVFVKTIFSGGQMSIQKLIVNRQQAAGNLDLRGRIDLRQNYLNQSYLFEWAVSFVFGVNVWRVGLSYSERDWWEMPLALTLLALVGVVVLASFDNRKRNYAQVRDHLEQLPETERLIAFESRKEANTIKIAYLTCREGFLTLTNVTSEFGKLVVLRDQNQHDVICAVGQKFSGEWQDIADVIRPTFLQALKRTDRARE